MLERTLAILSLAGLLAFCGTIVWYMQRVDLTVVIGGVVLMAAYDFIRELNGKTRLARNNNSQRQRDQS